MKKPAYDVAALIENIKRRCSVPTSQLTYTDEEFTALANDELQGEIVPMMMSLKEEYFLTYVDIPTPADGIINLPSDTVGQKVRSVSYKYPGRPLILINLPRIDLDTVTGVGPSYTTLSPLAMTGFFIQGNQLVLYPNNVLPVNTTIRIYYFKRSLVLAEPSNYGRIESIDVNTNTVILDSLPPEWEAGTVLNNVQQESPFSCTNEEITIVNVSNPSVILDNVDNLQVGDFLSEKYYSAVPQIPIEAHAYLAQLTAAKCLEGLGDESGMAIALKKAESLKANLHKIFISRVDGSPKKVMASNGGIKLASGLGRWGRRY
jgi:hypothetical protein